MTGCLLKSIFWLDGQFSKHYFQCMFGLNIVKENRGKHNKTEMKMMVTTKRRGKTAMVLVGMQLMTESKNKNLDGRTRHS